MSRNHNLRAVEHTFVVHSHGFPTAAEADLLDGSYGTLPFQIPQEIPDIPGILFIV